METFLVDTSVQIKRLLSEKWKRSACDVIWSEYDPVTCTYVLMEFKNSVIAAIRFLVSVLEEIAQNQAAQRIKDPVGVRLGEVIQQMNIETTKYEGDRRRRIANAYAVRVLQENSAYPRVRSVAEVIQDLKREANDLERFWFYYFPRDGQPEFMDVLEIVGCGLAKERSPMKDGSGAYHCARGRFKCGVVRFVKQDEMQSVFDGLSEQRLRFRDSRLRRAIARFRQALEEEHLDEDSSVGEKLCFGIGDAIIVSKAKRCGSGVITADRDQVALAEHHQIPCLFYDSDACEFQRQLDGQS